jgi:hypothetical protein
MPVGGRLNWDETEWVRVFGTGGPVAQYMRGQAEIVTQGAKRRAPVSPAGSNGRGSGYLRSSIGWEMGNDGQGMYFDIQALADYALMVEVGTAPHVIESHGDYPLRNARTGAVFGKRVNHPGTAAQPFLRPALDDIRDA